MYRIFDVTSSTDFNVRTPNEEFFIGTTEDHANKDFSFSVTKPDGTVFNTEPLTEVEGYGKHWCMLSGEHKTYFMNHDTNNETQTG